ncbi:MAG: endonuclease domain-containing protein [Oscillospiraceae bacterium]|nr:endonuclease domain-containing protein [Oscillospiraceae bacterium]
MKSNDHLPKNYKLIERARELRKNSTLSEVLFWNKVKNKQFLGLDFDRQTIIGNFIVDFFCSSKKIVIEIDGKSHIGKENYDKLREEYLTNLGLKVIRINDLDIKANINAVMEKLELKMNAE